MRTVRTVESRSIARVPLSLHVLHLHESPRVRTPEFDSGISLPASPSHNREEHAQNRRQLGIERRNR